MDRGLFFKNFRDALDRIYGTVERKNQDYSGDDQNVFRNFLLCEKLGICRAEAGMLVRMSDKLSRASTLIRQDRAVEDEKLQDTLLDLASYAIIMYIFIDESSKQEDKASYNPEVEDSGGL